MVQKTKTPRDIRLKMLLKDDFVEGMIGYIERFQKRKNCIVDINYDANIRLRK